MYNAAGICASGGKLSLVMIKGMTLMMFLAFVIFYQVFNFMAVFQSSLLCSLCCCYITMV